LKILDDVEPLDSDSDYFDEQFSGQKNKLQKNKKRLFALTREDVLIY